VKIFEWTYHIFFECVMNLFPIRHELGRNSFKISYELVDNYLLEVFCVF
jgi:hypothetical protein